MESFLDAPLFNYLLRVIYFEFVSIIYFVLIISSSGRFKVFCSLFKVRCFRSGERFRSINCYALIISSSGRFKVCFNYLLRVDYFEFWEVQGVLFIVQSWVF